MQNPPSELRAPEPATSPGSPQSTARGKRKVLPGRRVKRRPRASSAPSGEKTNPLARKLRDPDDPRIGQVIEGRYRVLSRLGSGGMAAVYLAEHLGIGGEVAVKFLHSDVAGDQRFLRRFEVEARALARIDHPHCVSVRDFGVADVPYIVMPCVAGPTLQEELKKKGRMSAKRTIAIIRQLLAALAHAHERGIIHRDVKPANIKLQQDTRDHVRLLDFGLAKLREPVAGMPPTNPLIAVGTPSYMSPEQFAGGTIDLRTDIYSTGATLFELLAGRRPFDFDHVSEACQMHREWPRPRIRHVVPEADYSAELEAVILTAMAQSPDDRFQTTDEFRDALDAVPEAAASPHIAAPARRVVEADRQDRTSRTSRAPRRKAEPARGKGIWLFAVAVLACVAGVGLRYPSLLKKAEGAASPPPQEVVAPVAESDAKAPVGFALEDGAAAATMRRADEYFARGRWSRAMVLYGRAIRLDPSLRDSSEMYRKVILALSEKDAGRAAARLIERELGAHAIPHLEEAASGSDSARLRRRAGRLLAKLRRAQQ